MKESQDDKAIRLVAQGHVQVIHHSTDVLWGHVVGDSGKQYRVEVNPEGTYCDCRFGVEQGGQHSHTRALELAAAALTQGVING